MEETLTTGRFGKEKGKVLKNTFYVLWTSESIKIVDCISLDHWNVLCVNTNEKIR